MKTIYKYKLEVTDEQIIEIPAFSEILTVQTQNEIPYIWALVDPKFYACNYKFRIIGTGHKIEDGFNGKYIGSVQLSSDKLVFHVFLIK